MTTTQFLTSHHLTVDFGEDNMEMTTSPYPQPHDGDDDIDFELDDQREHSVEDNSMIDDTTENLDINPNQDDMMLYDDDDNDLVDFDQDLPMEPNESSYTHDQDIHGEEDASLVEPETHDQTIQDASFEDTNFVADDTESMNGERDENGLQEEATNTEITITEDDLTIFPTEKNETDPRNQDEPNDQFRSVAAEEENLVDTQTTDIKDFAVEAVSEEPARAASEHPQDENDSTHVESSVEAIGSPEINAQNEKSTDALAAEIDEPTQDQINEADAKVETITSNETHRSPQREVTPVNLHPVTVRYNGEDCWLFPPFENADTKHVFLDDPALASEPFDRLIAALRSNLINNEEMADHDELVFDIPVLGLHICEDSKHASLLNLSRVIDIYMMLSQNEGLTVFEPLYCELSTRVCLADQFAYVEEAAFVRRISYADFAAEQAGSPEEIPQLDDPSVQEDEEEEEEEEEQTRADISTYHDAADDHDDEGEPLATAAEAQETEAQTDVATERASTQSLSLKAEVETLNNDDDGKEDSSLAPDDIDDLTGSRPEADSDDATLTTNVENGVQNEQDQNDDNNEEGRQYEAIAKPSDDASVHVEPEGDEDLFADDPVEPEVPETESGKTSQAPEANSLAADQETLDNIEDNDDFDFENWSDDEPDVTKVEEVSALLSTPSKSVNSKRKLIIEDDDFLDIDVSTPEPKRSRQS